MRHYIPERDVFFCIQGGVAYESTRNMNVDKFIKQLFISLSMNSQYYDITISTFEKFNEEYNCITRSILLQYKEPKGKSKYIQTKMWCKNKQELVLELNKLWQSRKQTKNKKK